MEFFDIILKLGGEEKAIQILARATGHRIKLATIAKWYSRGFIPTGQAVHLLDECARRGVRAFYRRDCVLAGAPPPRLHRSALAAQLSENNQNGRSGCHHSERSL